MGEFLAQLGANKLMLSKLSASYGLGNLPMGMPPLEQHQALQNQQQQQQQLSPLDDCASDKEREVRIQQIFESAIGDTSKKQIVEILEKISILRPPERLLLYLRMPGGYPETDPLRQSQNPLGTRSEINHTINWVRSHLEHDPNVSIPKQEVYDDYTAFCERIDIKPLSTADFGKVMKQVFPGIRPRRLGTRGHSRYCYAAMRKATKLAAPKLPDLSTSSSSGGGGSGSGGEKKSDPEDQVPTDEEAWKVIKLWAEAMLPEAFGSINELAGFITKHNLNSPASIASRQLLQKKLLQREIKERKKLTAAALKKRRRKRRKTLSTSLDSEVSAAPPPAATAAASSTASSRDANAQLSLKATPDAATSSAASVLQQVVKLERPDYTDEDNNNTATPLSAAVSLKQQHQQLSTNLNCDTSNSNNNNNNALAAASAVLAAGRQMRSPAEEYILCKKVRQAQQLKAAAQSQQSGGAMLPQHHQQHHQQQHQPHMPNPLRTPSAAAKRAASFAHLARQKRLRLLQQQQQRSIEAQNNSGPSYDEMGNLILIESQDLVTSSSKEDFIIPRERVISICNMDKNALDDYLQCDEDNSQDQDQELLKYFPEENQVDDGGGNGGGMVPGTSLETGGLGMLEDHDTNFKLSQLRSMLEQNMNQGGGMDKPQVGGQLDGFDGSGQQLNLQPGSASASLAMLSQRHHGSTVSSLDSSNTCNSTETKKNLSAANMKLALEGCLNSLGNGSANINAVNNGTPLQSPNGRRKNYVDFVPISAGPQSPRVPLAKSSSHQNNTTPNASPFVSPRNTPIHRKSGKPSNNNGLTLNILPQNQSHPGYHPRPGFVKNELSASAPPSPSIVQNYRFGMNPNVLNCQNSIPSFQPICLPSSQMQSHQTMPGSLESRSSSVPLIANYDAYNHSNYTSVSQTPVPSECDDFSDPNNILDMLNEPPSSTANNIQQQSIKLEESEPMISHLLDQDDMFPKASVPFSSLSRSVPSTPLPHQMSFNHSHHQSMGAGSFGTSSTSKALFELPKSVPSTPISLNNNRESLFQYSPETSRDYLINGNSVDRTSKLGGPSFYSNQGGSGTGAGAPVNTGASGASGGPTGTAANGTTAASSAVVVVPTSSGSGSEMSILADGIESLTDALIGSDTLRYL